MAYARNLVDGVWEEAGPKSIETVDPADRRADRPRAAQHRGRRRARRAAARPRSPRGRRTPAPRRGEILFRARRDHGGAQGVARRGSSRREMGKVHEEALGDVQEAIDMAYLHGGEGRRLYGATTPSRAARTSSR